MNDSGKQQIDDLHWKGIRMGYAVGRFSEEVNENLLCSICSCVLEEAVLTPCGHSFCNTCLTTWIEARAAGEC